MCPLASGFRGRVPAWMWRCITSTGGRTGLPATSLLADFLEYHRLSRSPYNGVFSEITETGEYPSLDACGKAVLARLNPAR